MSAQFSSALCFLILSSPLFGAGTQIQETISIGAGFFFTALGCKLLHKSTKKKGTSAQAIVGLAVTIAGLLAMTQGPRAIRSSQSGNTFSFTNADQKYDSHKKHTRKWLRTTIPKESDAVTKVGYQIYGFLLDMDIFRMIPLPEKANA